MIIGGTASVCPKSLMRKPFDKPVNIEYFTPGCLDMGKLHQNLDFSDSPIHFGRFLSRNQQKLFLMENALNLDLLYWWCHLLFLVLQVPHSVKIDTKQPTNVFILKSVDWA